MHNRYLTFNMLLGLKNYRISAIFDRVLAHVKWPTIFVTQLRSELCVFFAQNQDDNFDHCKIVSAYIC